MGMTPSQLDRLDIEVRAVLAGDDSGVGVLSTGERYYVALAANRADLLAGASIVSALDWIGLGNVREMLVRWNQQ